jgi:hypothetical protein
MPKFEAGDKVRQVLPPPIVGVVGKFAFDEKSGNISYRVDFADDKGAQVHQRFFRENELEKVVS